jgi:UDP-2,4-diacetamido-2,4,6-trideoxy-beta-L-altropyranose hydrolase
LVQVLKEIVDTGLNATWSENCQKLVDGGGAGRVRCILMLNVDTPLRARRAQLNDEALILEWANDPLVRQNAFIGGAIDADTHRAWFRNRLDEPEKCQLYVVESEEGMPVGQVRFERSGDSWEIHYGLDGRFRGRGVGSKLLESALKTFRNNGGRQKRTIFGRVKPANKPSCQVFRKLGFSEESTGDELIYRQDGR